MKEKLEKIINDLKRNEEQNRGDAYRSYRVVNTEARAVANEQRRMLKILKRLLLELDYPYGLPEDMR
jgi:hypothetical protein